MSLRWLIFFATTHGILYITEAQREIELDHEDPISSMLKSAGSYILWLLGLKPEDSTDEHLTEDGILTEELINNVNAKLNAIKQEIENHEIKRKNEKNCKEYHDGDTDGKEKKEHLCDNVEDTAGYTPAEEKGNPKGQEVLPIEHY